MMKLGHMLEQLLQKAVEQVIAVLDKYRHPAGKLDGATKETPITLSLEEYVALSLLASVGLQAVVEFAEVKEVVEATIEQMQEEADKVSKEQARERMKHYD